MGLHRFGGLFDPYTSLSLSLRLPLFSGSRIVIPFFRLYDTHFLFRVFQRPEAQGTDVDTDFEVGLEDRGTAIVAV